MKRGKQFLALIFLGAFILISFGFAIAQKQGELYSLPAKVNVTVRNSLNPPIIVYVNNVTVLNEVTNLNKALSTRVGSVMVFNFWAYSDAGEDTLPGTIIGQSVGGLIKGNFSLISGSKVRNIVNCTYRGVVPTAAYPPGNAKNYTCNVTMWYSDDPTPSAWNISVQINESGGSTPGNALFSNTNATQSFKLNKMTDFDITPGSVNWTSNIIYTGSIDKTADNAIKIMNLGNIPITTASTRKLRLMAYDLRGEVDTSKYFGATNFTASEGSACSAIYLFSNAAYQDLTLSVTTASNPPSVNSSTDLNFCAKTATEVYPQSYSTIPGSEWQIDDYCNGCLL